MSEKTTVNVRDVWWEDDDTLCVEDEHGKVTRYLGAKLTGVSGGEILDQPGVTSIPITVHPTKP